MSPLRGLVVGVVSSLAVWATAMAQLPVGGYVKFYHHNRWEGSSGISRTGTRLQLTVDQSLGDRAAFFGSMDFDIDEVRGREDFLTDRGANVDVYPVEMYVDLYWPWLDLRLGKQFIFWGKTEWINPTDNINPWDYANISAEIEDYRIAVNAVKADFYVSSLTIEGVLVPVFTPDRIPGGPGMSGPQGPPWFGVQLPKATLQNAQVAFRLMHSFQGIDWSASYYRGNMHQPATVLVTRCIPDPCRLGLAQVYPKVQIFGADFQRVFGRWGLRGEGAYFLTEDRDGSDPWIPNPSFEGVAALEFTPNDDFGLVLQWDYQRKFKYDPARDATAYAQMHVPWKPDRKQRHAFSARLRWQPGDYWSTQLISVVNADSHDRFVLAFVNYQPVDALNVTVGGVFFGGRPSTPFGRMANQDRLFVELKASF